MTKEQLIQQHILQYENKTFISPYIIPHLIVKKLKDSLHIDLTYEYIKQIVMNSKINITEKDIDNHLEEIRKETDGKYNNKPLEEMIFTNLNEAENFKSEHLNYYKTYLSILKQKITLMLILIDGLMQMNKDDDTICLIEKLDIELYYNGYVSQDDITRVINALCENIIDLLNILNKANTLTTYSQPHTAKFKRAVDVKNLPSTDLQVKDIYTTDGKGYIRLSKRQYDELMKNETSNFQRVIEMINKEDKK